MTKEYLGSVGNRHNLTRYVLANRTEVILNEDELEELFLGSSFYEDNKDLETKNEKLEYQNEHYKSIIKDFNSLLDEMRKVK